MVDATETEGRADGETVRGMVVGMVQARVVRMAQVMVLVCMMERMKTTVV